MSYFQPASPRLTSSPVAVPAEVMSALQLQAELLM